MHSCNYQYQLITYIPSHKTFHKNIKKNANVLSTIIKCKSKQDIMHYIKSKRIKQSPYIQLSIIGSPKSQMFDPI